MSTHPYDLLSDLASPADPDAPKALEVVRAELMALDDRALVPVNVDVASAGLVAIGAAREIQRYRAELIALVGETLAAPIDRLELVAMAAIEAHAEHRAVESGADLAPTVARVTDFRELFRAEIRTLVTRRLLPKSVLSQLTAGQGHKNLAFDVLQLVAGLRQAWEIVEARTSLRPADLDGAEAAANALIRAVGLRDLGARSPSADLRQRAFSLLVDTYDDVRRLTWFLRWKRGDADRIAPSFYQGRGRRRAQPPTEILPDAATGSETRR